MAGIAAYRIRIDEGHAPQDQTDEYLYHETQQHLKEDAAKFKKWLAAFLKKTPVQKNVGRVTRG
jgi:hypothetical protein